MLLLCCLARSSPICLLAKTALSPATHRHETYACRKHHTTDITSHPHHRHARSTHACITPQTSIRSCGPFNPWKRKAIMLNEAIPLGPVNHVTQTCMRELQKSQLQGWFAESPERPHPGDCARHARHAKPNTHSPTATRWASGTTARYARNTRGRLSQAFPTLKTGTLPSLIREEDLARFDALGFGVASSKMWVQCKGQ